MKTDANAHATTSDDTERDDAQTGDDIRYGLTALGEALLSERGKGRRFRGFGPCAVAAFRAAG